MAGERTKKMLDRIQMLLGLTDQVKIPPTTILGFMDDAQSEIAETTLSVESSASLTVAASATTEPTGFYRMKLIALASGTLIQPEEISVNDYDAMTRYTFSPPASVGMYFKRWNGTITFYPTLSAGTYTCYFYKTPSTNCSTSVDPETPARFDPSVEYYSIYHLAPFVGKLDLVSLYKGLYDASLKDAIQSQRRTKPGIYQIAFHDV